MRSNELFFVGMTAVSIGEDCENMVVGDIDEKTSVKDESNMVVDDTDEKIGFKDEPSPAVEDSLDLDRIHISPVPKYFGFKQFRKLLEKHLKGIEIKKIRQMKFDAYVSFKTPEDAQSAISKLNGLEVKKTVLKVQLAPTETKTSFDPSTQQIKPKTARESVTPLADVPYSEQLQQKMKESLRVCDKLLIELKKANVDGASNLKSSELVKKVGSHFTLEADLFVI
ncbi:unnamed protein product [Cylicostephanus goldi]|uniref:RRM domain-containing protein n=1 Tax=Cylicostephanus goldi TaxID=71465 RepID=A0A3P6QJJ2_CYLGO|nr:unnamed protein product [Cylicostephanus goldi]